MALIKGLPYGSATQRAVDPEGHRWGITEELLAVLIELIDHSNRMYLSVNSKKGTPLPPAVRIPRPGEQAKQSRRRPSTPDELKRAFGAAIRVVPKEPK